MDLGCGIGDLSADLSARGARVVGVDMNEELVLIATDRHIANAQFRIADLRTFRDSNISADGIWSSFTAAYFPALHDTVTAWKESLRPGGWLAMIEMDDLFGHYPVSTRTEELLNGYVQDSLKHSRYDFRMGRKIGDILQAVGLVLQQNFTVPDAELSFSGPASPQVLAAWRTRFDRMYLLQEFCGPEFELVRNDFLNCLKRDDHLCTASVRCCIATN